MRLKKMERVVAKGNTRYCILSDSSGHNWICPVDMVDQVDASINAIEEYWSHGINSAGGTLDPPEDLTEGLEQLEGEFLTFEMPELNGVAIDNKRTVTTQLKPCPFCGKSPTVKEYGDKECRPGTRGYYSCRIFCEYCRGAEIEDNSKETATNRWNTRICDSSKQALDNKRALKYEE